MAEKKNFVLRIDQVSYKALEKWASDEFRSVNGQIEFILHQALKEQFGPQFQQKFGYKSDPLPELNNNELNGSDESGNNNRELKDDH